MTPTPGPPATRTFPHNGRLASNATYTQARQVLLPEDLTGSFFLIVKTDSSPRNDVFEYEAEHNNTAVFPVHIQLPPVPDLQVTSVMIPETAWSGQSLSVEWTVTNPGAAEANSQNGWWDSVYLSRDPYLDKQRDIALGSVLRQGVLAAGGGTYTGRLDARLPVGITGPYYVLVMTDSNDRVFEREFENNNVTASAATVQINLTPPADLVVSQITIPESAIYGEPVTWEFEVTNQGVSDAVGQWYDTIYLSSDPYWDLDDPRVARVLHRGDLRQGESYTASVVAPVPAVVPGDYYVIVRTDILNNVRELDQDNNLRVSEGTFRPTGRHLTLDEVVSGTLAAEQSLYYQLDMTAGEDLAVVLSGAAARNAEVFVAFERLATRSDFDVRGETFGDGDIRARVPRTSTGTFYVLLYGRTTLPGPREFTLSASLLEFALDSMSPSSGGNSGEVTVKILGTHLPEEPEVALLGSGGERIIGRIHPYTRDLSAITATFDLAGVLPGTYSVEVIDLETNENAQLANAFQLKDTTGWVAGPDDFTAEIVLPTVIRARGNQPQWVDGFLVYRNTGSHDVLSPMLTLTASNGGVISLRPNDVSASDTLQIIALNPQGPANVLPPGAEFRLPIYVRVPGWQAVEVSVNWLGVWPGSEADTPLDWSYLFLPLPPGQSNPAVDSAIAMLQAERGTTWAEYIQRLGTTAAILNYYGELEYTVESLEPYIALAQTQTASTRPQARKGARATRAAPRPRARPAFQGGRRPAGVHRAGLRLRTVRPRGSQGAHLLDWHGAYRPVTFNPDLFDRHPNTLTLMTYGGGLLERVLEAVDPPADARAACQVVRCRLDGAVPLVGYYRAAETRALRSLAELRASLAHSDPAAWNDAAGEAVAARFTEAARGLLARETKAAQSRHSARVSSLTEEIRQLLSQAAYVELAQAASRDLFDDYMPLDFSEAAYDRLKRHKVPFAGALRLINTGLPRLRADDPFFLRMKDSKRDVLTRRFEAIKTRLSDRLRQLVEAKRGGGPTGQPGSDAIAQPDLCCYATRSFAADGGP